MTPVDVWAAVAVFAAAGLIGMRRFMFKPSFRTWVAAPWAVRRGLSLLALALCLRGATVCSGSIPANEGEATLYTVLAIVAGVMALNVARTGRETRPPR